MPGATEAKHVFDLCDYTLCVEHPLGGWNGELPPVPEVAKLTSEEFQIDRTDGPSLIFKAGLPYGARSVAEYELDDL